VKYLIKNLKIEMTDEEEIVQLDLIETERGIVKEKGEHYFQVDILKAAMIFLVIFDHTVPYWAREQMAVRLWEGIAIPIFLVIMGFNMGLSFNQLESKALRKLYSRKYFKKKFWRNVFPFLILLGLSILIGTIFEVFYNYPAFEQYRTEGLFHFVSVFLGILQFWGPGNWFIPVLFLSILIMPLLYKGMSAKWGWRIFTLFICFLTEIVIQLLFYIFFTIPNTPFTTTDDFYAFFSIYHIVFSTPFVMLSGIGLGMWFSTKNNEPSIFSKQNYFMWILFPLSLFYIIQFCWIFEFRIEFMWTEYTLLFFPYSAFLFLIMMKILPKKGNSKFTKAISSIGRATYHILLAQILYFAMTVAIWGEHYGASIFGLTSETLSEELQVLTFILFFIINSTICAPIGVLWWYSEIKVRDYLLRRKRSKTK